MGIPAMIPSTTEMSMIEMNGWILNFEIITIISTMATIKARISGKPVIILTSFF